MKTNRETCPWRDGLAGSLLTRRARSIGATVLAATLGLATLSSPAWAPDEEPLRAWIVDGDSRPVEALAVQTGQPFALFGIATGGFRPYVYSWKQGPLLLSTTDVLSYSFSEVGEYLIELRVRDMLNQEAADSLVVSVILPPTPVRRSTWGGLKARYR